MNGEQLKKKLQAGGVVYGTMLSMSRNPRWATPINDFGLDFVIIDSEHAPRGRSEISDLLTAFGSTGLVTIVRLPYPDGHRAAMELDAGAQGVLAPYCETVQEAKDVAGSVKWRNLKGAYLKKVMDTGDLPSEETRAYLQERNRNNICIIGIESVPGIENLPNILKVDGVDAIFVGPNDLSTSLGIPDKLQHPDYEAALRKIISICRAQNVPVLIHHQTLELTQKWLKEGARFVLYSSDARTIHNGFRRDFESIKAVGKEIGGGSAKEVGESQEVI